jgi:cytochrome c553
VLLFFGFSPDAARSEEANLERSRGEGRTDDGLSLSNEQLGFATDVFASTCATCHEADGRGTTARLNLVDGEWHHGGSLEEIERTIRDGVAETDMAAQKEHFDDAQIAVLARYVRLLSGNAHARTVPVQTDAQAEVAVLTRHTAGALLPVRVAPASPAETDGAEQIVDRHIFGKMQAAGVPHADLCTDHEFLRRVYLDLWGRLPDVDEVRRFLTDETADKRHALIDRLLGLDFMQKPGHDDYKGPWLVEKPFLDKWTYFFGDLFRNGQQGNADRFRDYIHTFLRFNIPYDYVVRDMLTATAITGQSSGVAGFLTRHEVDGLRCADVMHEDTCDEIALHTTRLFLGVNLECVSCHDGKGHVDSVNLWLSRRERYEFWRQAAFFGDLRIFRASLQGQEFTLLDGAALRPERIWQGKIDQYESAGSLTPSGGLGYRLDAPSVLRVPRDPNADVFAEFILTRETPAEGANPRHEYARMITTHPQFAKATVNLIWSRFMTTGIVEPVLDWDLDRQDPAHPPPAPWTIQPSHPELLEELAGEFRDSGCDLRLLMRTIVRSKAYQLSSCFEGEYPAEYDRYYARKLVRRLSAEEIYDALAKATNVFGHGIQFALEQVGPPGDAELRQFLDVFGQSNRNTKLADTRVTAVQAALLMNSDLVKQKVSAKTEGSLVHTLTHKDPPLSGDRMAEELYLATLSRFPTAQEAAGAAAHIDQHGVQGAEDVQWALINRPEFIVNY